MGRKVKKYGNKVLPPPPPVSSRAKDYSGDERPSEVTDELDELRNRGIAKLLNRHFTDTTHRLAEEKAAADAALKDLEDRRARTSEFVPSKGGELNPFDSLYVELQQKKLACRRKEKETLLLYQRYVQKFGNTGLVAAPEPKKKKGVKKVDASSQPPMPNKERSTENAGTTDPSQPPVVPPDVNFQKFYHRQLAERDSTAIANMEDEDDNDGVVETEMPSQQQEETVIKADEPGIKTEFVKEATPEKIEDPQPELADVQMSDPTPEPVVIPDDKPAEQESTIVDTNIPIEEHVSEEQEIKSPPGLSPSPQETQEVANEQTPAVAPILQEEVKGLPEDLPVVVKDEKAQEGVPVAEISKVSSKRQAVTTDPSEADRPTIVVSTEVPSATTATDEDDDSDLRSIISGLTSVNSAVTRQVLDEVETQLESFIKTETENIRKIMDEEDKSFVSGMEGSSGSFLGSESQYTTKAEAMARQMQKILDGFKNDSSVAPDPAKSNEDGSSTKSEYPRKYETANTNEKWIVLYDSTYQREYYHETVSNRTQWEPPTNNSVEQVDDSDVLSHADVKPESQRQTRKSRMSAYRKKMRRRRMRRLVVLLIFFLAAVCGTWYWQMYHPGKSLQEVSTLMVENAKEQLEYAKDQFEYTFTDRLAREEAERNQQKSAEQIQKEKRAKEDAERKAKLEAERLAAEEQKRQQKIAEDLKAQEEKRLRELKEKEQAELKKLMKAVEEEKARERRLREESEALRRPWGCNLPLAYVLNRRCRRLSSQNPIYKETDIVFLQ